MREFTAGVARGRLCASQEAFRRHRHYTLDNIYRYAGGGWLALIIDAAEVAAVVASARLGVVRQDGMRVARSLRMSESCPAFRSMLCPGRGRAEEMQVAKTIAASEPITLSPCRAAVTADATSLIF